MAQRLRLFYCFLLTASSLPSLHRLPLPSPLANGLATASDVLFLRFPLSSNHTLALWSFGPLAVGFTAVVVYNLLNTLLTCCCRARGTTYSSFYAKAARLVVLRRQLSEGMTTTLLWVSFLCYLPLCDALARGLKSTADDATSFNHPIACVALAVYGVGVPLTYFSFGLASRPPAPSSATKPTHDVEQGQGPTATATTTNTTSPGLAITPNVAGLAITPSASQFGPLEAVECLRCLSLTTLNLALFPGKVQGLFLALSLAVAWAAGLTYALPFATRTDNRLCAVTNWALVVVLAAGLSVRLDSELGLGLGLTGTSHEETFGGLYVALVGAITLAFVVAG